MTRKQARKHRSCTLTGSGGALARRISISALVAVLPILVLAVLTTGWRPVLAAAKAKPKPAPVGIAASWLPTSSPITAIPGRAASGKFWVSNDETTPVGIHILEGTVMIGNNGALALKPGPDPRFPGDITYSPHAFRAAPHSTTQIAVTFRVPAGTAPGVYILGFVVVPQIQASGAIRVVNEIDAIVTFQVPGTVSGQMHASFRGSTLHFPGLPPLEFSTHGTDTVRVADTGRSTLWSYNEITVGQASLGAAIVAGHTAGEVGDLRYQVALFFPGRWRDYPVRWHPSGAGVGVAHLQARVYYRLTPSQLVSTSATASVLVVAPWWLLVLTGLEVLALAGTVRRRHKIIAAQVALVASAMFVARPVRRRTAVAHGGMTILVLAVVVASALIGKALVFGPAAALVAAGVSAVALMGRRRSLKQLRSFIVLEAVGVAAVLGSAVVVVLLGLGHINAGWALGAIAGAGAWILGCRLGLQIIRRVAQPLPTEHAAPAGTAAMGDGEMGSDGPEVTPT